MTVDAEKDFVAIGQLAASVGKSVRVIEQTAERLKLNPALRINRVPFYNGVQIEKLPTELNRSKGR